MSRERLGSFVDGQWLKSSAAETFTVINPTTESIYGIASIGTAPDVDRAVRSAHRALRGGVWPTMSVEERCLAVERIGELLSKKTKELALIQAKSTGGLYRNALRLGDALQFIEMFVESVKAVDFEYLRNDRYGSTVISRRPVGVVAAIVPWNAPIRSEVKKVIPALLAGCTVVLKPAEEVVFGAAIFGEICAEAGLPPGVVNIVPGDGSTGAALVSHPLVSKVAFTGSTATGTRIASATALSFTRLQLELGGKSAAVLLDDVDLDLSIPWLVRANFSNAGQMCVALTRILVSRNRYDEAVEALGAAANALVVGDPLDDASEMGPLVTRRHRDKVIGLINAGVAEGARLVAGGGRPDIDRGWFVQPTVFADVDNTMQIAREEVFGPVACVIPFDSVEEAIGIANDSVYGLHGAVFGRDDERALDVARRIESGSVAVNRCFLPHSAPFGGIKRSGVGREHGPEGYDSFLEYHSYNISHELSEKLGGTSNHLAS